MLDIGDLGRINPNNAEDFLKFISYNRDMFLHRVTAQLGSFVENGFLKTLFDKSSQAMDKAQLLVKMFGKSLYALSRSWDNFATCAYTLYGDMDEDTELECPSINNDLFTSTSSSNTKTTPNPKKDKQKARVTVDKQVKNQSTMANPDVQTSAKKPYKELKWYQHSIPTLMKKHKPKAKNTLNKKSGITGNVLDSNKSKKKDAQILLHVIKKFLMLNFANSEKDRETIANLYMQGFLNITIPSPADVFWNCFRDSYNANPNGIDGKIRILSIIGENFIYKDMIDELEVSPNSINAARKFSRINGPEYKENINMSSYKVDAKTQLYLKDQKNALWEKFSAIYPDGMKCTSFIAHLQNSQFKY
ncbi:hypothetical protein RhiirA5_426965 [Rhizophagus irregularis]|uniref:Uncharacterized protein n=1 Tax=Rhizophagus irregularis TaxID=588596 RepID=A0A2N0P388_9GLOM|nr:hypothetical protein RhiirA5_426965 [Rhizophagus irregularis]